MFHARSRLIVVGILAVLVLSGTLWPTSAMAQGCDEGFLSGLFGPKCISDRMIWARNNETSSPSRIEADVTWSETSAKDKRERVMTTVRVIFSNRSLRTDPPVSVRISRFTLLLMNDSDLELHTYSPSLGPSVFLFPGDSKRVDFRVWLDPGLIADVENLSGTLGYHLCDENRSDCN